MIVRRYLEVDGLRLSYLERGRAVAGVPSLLILHGLMGCADTMRPLMQELSSDLHVLALDLPGAGESERRPNLKATLAFKASIVHRFSELAGISEYCLVGHSHGGAVAMYTAATYSGRIRSLSLLAPAHPWFEESDPLIRFYLSLPGRLFAYSMPWYPKWMQMMGLRRMAGPQSWDTVEKLIPYRNNLRTPGTISHLLRLLSTWHKDMAELRKLMRKPLAIPAVLIWGDSDKAVPALSVKKLRAHLRYSELHILQGVGHRPAEETPRAVAWMLDEWLRRPVEALTGYSPNDSLTHERIAELISPSFEAGESAVPAKKWSASRIQTMFLGAEADARIPSSASRGAKLSWSPMTKSFGTPPHAGKNR